jgi:aminoglycoside phosphotransferase family enzyme/predicted kinase
MGIDELIDMLARPDAYGARPDRVEVRQTHISVVFLAGAFAYKIKKPVSLGFVDFSTLALRRRACDEEVRLNRRLAPDVYLGVVAVVASPSTDDHGAERLVFDEAGAQGGDESRVVEWAVKMRRLNDEDSMLSALSRGELTAADMTEVAERLAAFHAQAARDERIASFGSLAIVAGNARENLQEVTPDLGSTVSAPVFERLCARTDEWLRNCADLIERRARAGLPCDGHGDLRLEHIYRERGRSGAGAILVIDCVEFNERFRFGDPILDIAFLVMELVFHGRDDLAQAFVAAYLARSADDEGRPLLPFYVSYRSTVRGKVRSLELRQPEIPADRRSASLGRAKAHFLLALGMLEPPARRPALALMGGLPGTGKSTLARALAAHAGFSVIRTDVVRAELFPELERGAGHAGYAQGLYSPERVARTYAECLSRAEAKLFLGERVIVDASFAAESERDSFARLANAYRVPLVWLVCRADPNSVRARLAGRTGDASDADVAVYEIARQHWEKPGETMRRAMVEIDSDQDSSRSLEAALHALGARHLFAMEIKTRTT